MPPKLDKPATRIIFFSLPLVLSGCGTLDKFGGHLNPEIASWNRAYIQPASGAQIRLVTDGAIRLVPARNCIDWYAPGSGVALSKAKKNQKNPYLGNTLGIPGGNPDDHAAEVRVSAGKPVTLVYSVSTTIIGNKHRCETSGYFTPLAGKNYQAWTSLTDRKCMISISEVATDSQQKTIYIPVRLNRIAECKETGDGVYIGPGSE